MLVVLSIISVIFLKKHYETFSNSKINIWIINLDKDKDRLNKFRQNLQLKNNNNINLIRHSAILGKKVNKTDALYKKFIAPDFKAATSQTDVFNKEATLGCALSHVLLYNKLYDTYKNNPSYKYFIICEDDAIVSDNFSKKLKTIFDELPKDWDFVYLGGNISVGKKYSKNLIIPDLSQNNYGFFGYMLSKKGLEKVVKHCKNINIPIDNFLKNKNLNYFTCNPHIIYHDYNNISNIVGKIRTSHSKKGNNIFILD